jgi:hypothetical protein
MQRLQVPQQTHVESKRAQSVCQFLRTQADAQKADMMLGMRPRRTGPGGDSVESLGSIVDQEQSDSEVTTDVSQSWFDAIYTACRAIACCDR